MSEHPQEHTANKNTMICTCSQGNHFPHPRQESGLLQHLPHKQGIMVRHMETRTRRGKVKLTIAFFLRARSFMTPQNTIYSTASTKPQLHGGHQLW